jgi:hypothetical protein
MQTCFEIQIKTVSASYEYRTYITASFKLVAFRNSEQNACPQNNKKLIATAWAH